MVDHSHPFGNAFIEMDVVVHVCDPGTWEAEAGKWRIQGQPEGHKKILSKIEREERS